MPELPEVEVTRRGLLPHLPKRRIISVSWSGKQLRQSVPMELIRQHICGRRIADIDRRAKYLLIRMADTGVLLLHLGMTGKLGIFPEAATRAKHDHLRLRLDNNMELRFNDVRRFGSVDVWPPEQAGQLEQTFNLDQGIEPLGPEFTVARLERLAANRKSAAKNFLMNSRLISGIGNIYANETLFAAGIHPLTEAGSLSAEQWQRIINCCISILNKAIEAGGSTISDFLGSSGRPGYFQLQLAVYGKKNQPCPICGQKIRKENISGRASFFCASCQPVSNALSELKQY